MMGVFSNNWFGKSHCKQNKSLKRQAALGLERLNERTTPAAGIILNSAASVAVTGTGQDDHVWIFQAGTKVHVRADGVEKIYDRSSIVRIVFNGNSGDDVITNSTSIPMIANGGAGSDTINGGYGRDIITGGLGDDSIRGKSGNDVIHGNEGRDAIDGGNGADDLFGDNDDDYLSGSAGYDSIYGGPGNDDLSGGSGNDRLHGDVGDDSIRGDDGNDSCRGGSGDDSISGGNGDDSLSGESGRDRLEGGSGDDSSHGSDDDSEIEIEHSGKGGSGNDDFDDNELKAVLSLAGSSATGEAEYETLLTGGQKIEVKVRSAPVNTTFTVFVGSTTVGSLRTNSLGFGKLEKLTTLSISAGDVLTVRDSSGASVMSGTFSTWNS